MKKTEKTPIKKPELDLVINVNEDIFDSTGKIINPDNISGAKTVNIQELKQLEKVLDSLISSGNEHIAGKYLEGFLEARSLISLNDYLKNLK